MRIVVVSNCQSYGLANSILQLAPSVAVIAQPGERLGSADLVKGADGEFDLMLVLNEYKDIAQERLSYKAVTSIPCLYFDRFHPDVTTVRSSDGVVKSDTDSYHSLIGLAAYLAGFSPNEAVRAFNEKTFEYAGYFDGWEEARDQMFLDFNYCGLDVRSDFLSWTLGGCFMHSHNHPKVHTLFSTARLILDKVGVSTLPVEECLIPDNLLNAAVMPVYPEIAERLGFKGSYVFKRHGTHRTIDLAWYVQKTYQVYDRFNRATLTVNSSKSKLLKRMIEYFS